MHTKYPPIEPYQTGQLSVSGGHRIYWEESGNPTGRPVLFIHGGPGSATEPSHRCFFDPKFYRIILVDQRGCGKSLPFASLEHNTTWDLISDFEQLRRHLKIQKWLLFGGSWGSTLALAYAETHPHSATGLILRGIFLGRKKEIDWFYQHGAHQIAPDRFEEYRDLIPINERGDLLSAYYKRLTSSDPHVREVAAKIWARWEGSSLKLLFNPAIFEEFTEDKRCEAIARIECHYFMNRCFFKTDNWLIEEISKVRSLPAVIVHGRYDLICPMENAWDLHKAWPEAAFEIIPDAGHSSSEPGITDALIRATLRFESL